MIISDVMECFATAQIGEEVITQPLYDVWTEARDFYPLFSRSCSEVGSTYTNLDLPQQLPAGKRMIVEGFEFSIVPRFEYEGRVEFRVLDKIYFKSYFYGNRKTFKFDPWVPIPSQVSFTVGLYIGGLVAGARSCPSCGVDDPTTPCKYCGNENPLERGVKSANRVIATLLGKQIRCIV